MTHMTPQPDGRLYYTIRHVTRFMYSAPISESAMEVRAQPRTEGIQRCLSFHLHTNPRAQILNYRDVLGNMVHHFDVPNRHTQLMITTQALVEMATPPALPESLDASAWEALDLMNATGEYWDFLAPTGMTQPSDLLRDLTRELDVRRDADPLTTLRRLNTAIHDAFDYVPQSTRVDSPIDDALRGRKGVCQDFAHIMLALARGLGIPCRYVSGYLFHRTEASDRSAQDATHAWVEALLPDLGWVGFDPTNDLIAAERHIRVATGREYADVPPTRGVFKGTAESELTVAVQVVPADPPVSDLPLATTQTGYYAEEQQTPPLLQQQQQQQQQ